MLSHPKLMEFLIWRMWLRLLLIMRPWTELNKIVGGEAAMAVILREIWLCVLGCSGIRAATGQEQTEKVTKK